MLSFTHITVKLQHLVCMHVATTIKRANMPRICRRRYRHCCRAMYIRYSSMLCYMSCWIFTFCWMDTTATDVPFMPRATIWFESRENVHRELGGGTQERTVSECLGGALSARFFLYAAFTSSHISLLVSFVPLLRAALLCYVVQRPDYFTWSRTSSVF